MYFPYLRGHQFELIALRELLEDNLISKCVLPVIEPVRLTSTLIKTIKLFNAKHFKYAIVLNPKVGSFSEELKAGAEKKVVLEWQTELKAGFLQPAFIMNESIRSEIIGYNLQSLMIVNQNHDCLENFTSMYKDSEPKYTLIPDDRSFIRKIKNSKVLFVDHFPKASRNVEYKNNIDEFFSDDHLYFEEEHFTGFADYSIVGADYSEAGFAPMAVAIHLVYFNPENILRIHHFVSDSNDDITDPAGKFGEAVTKLEKWVASNKITHTKGLNYLLECKKNGRYPGLGSVKKYTIMHHLELMNKFLEGDIGAGRG